jgi:hypothetical protein
MAIVFLEICCKTAHFLWTWINFLLSVLYLSLVMKTLTILVVCYHLKVWKITRTLSTFNINNKFREHGICKSEINESRSFIVTVSSKDSAYCFMLMCSGLWPSDNSDVNQTSDETRNLFWICRWVHICQTIFSEVGGSTHPPKAPPISLATARDRRSWKGAATTCTEHNSVCNKVAHCNCWWITFSCVLESTDYLY